MSGGHWNNFCFKPQKGAGFLLRGFYPLCSSRPYGDLRGRGHGKARYLRDPRWWQGLSCSCTAAFCTTCLAWRKPGMSQSCRVILAKFVLMGNAGDRWGCERRRELDRPRSALLPAASHVSALINARLGTCASCLWRTWLHSQSL